MRTYAVVGHLAPTGDGFTLDDLSYLDIHAIYHLYARSGDTSSETQPSTRFVAS